MTEVSAVLHAFYHPFSMLYANANLNNEVVSDRRFGVVGSGEFSIETIDNFHRFFLPSDNLLMWFFLLYYGIFFSLIQ